ncbi:DEKNAAC103688 [Brettanomyces naardenensis]|uniref:Lysyl-tRNA synthetase n=1 Tax=Brettanomyces naardenensis TaxID=13370 RepID=A0A448YP92_BRENA|nr:DEKNAAC103688 [Brettanomyces naardenensis]
MVGYRLIRLSRCYATKSPVATLRTDLEVENDFAGRKKTISESSFDLQGRHYYPRVGNLEETLSSGIDHTEKIRIPEFRDRYGKIFGDDPELHRIDDQFCIVSGKIKGIRTAGKGSMFIDLVQDYTKLQLMVHHKAMGLDKESFLEHHSQFRTGDQCICVGNPGTTRVGELSLRLTKPLMLASPALHPLPPKLTDPALINRNRVVDYLVNKKSKDIILTRFKIVSMIRRYLESRGFIEVATPVIGSGNSGANATPFVTSSVHLKQKDDESQLERLSLRVAPELWLKRLVIGGFDKVYEIGPEFRNEGVDATHNPEFTTCEFYQTFTSLEELMKMTEELIVDIAKDLAGSPISKNRCSKLLEEVAGNGGKFKRIDFIPSLERYTGLPLPEKLTSDNLLAYFAELGVEPPKVTSEYQLLDQLSSLYLEPHCQSCPTFIYNIPEILSPLAKSTEGISRRFELYVDGKELANAYEEENNPFVQEAKFETQLRLKNEFNDDETILPDYKYVQFMEWGMPPTGGWGLGIDRLVMLLTETERIDNVITFGRLPDVLKQ